MNVVLIRRALLILLSTRSDEQSIGLERWYDNQWEASTSFRCSSSDNDCSVLVVSRSLISSSNLSVSSKCILSLSLPSFPWLTLSHSDDGYLRNIFLPTRPFFSLSGVETFSIQHLHTSKLFFIAMSERCCWESKRRLTTINENDSSFAVTILDRRRWPSIRSVNGVCCNPNDTSVSIPTESGRSMICSLLKFILHLLAPSIRRPPLGINSSTIRKLRSPSIVRRTNSEWNPTWTWKHWKTPTFDGIDIRRHASTLVSRLHWRWLPKRWRVSSTTTKKRHSTASKAMLSASAHSMIWSNNFVEQSFNSFIVHPNTSIVPRRSSRRTCRAKNVWANKLKRWLNIKFLFRTLLTVETRSIRRSIFSLRSLTVTGRVSSLLPLFPFDNPRRSVSARNERNKCVSVTNSPSSILSIPRRNRTTLHSPVVRRSPRVTYSLRFVRRAISRRNTSKNRCRRNVDWRRRRRRTERKRSNNRLSRSRLTMMILTPSVKRWNQWSVSPRPRTIWSILRTPSSTVISIPTPANAELVVLFHSFIISHWTT